MLSLLRRVAVDLSPVRESREFRLLSLGQTVSSLGTQVALVALPYQIYVVSRSPALVGLLGAFELGPMVVVSLVGGAIADRRDRRPLLAASQLGVVAVGGALTAVSVATSRPPVIVLLVLGGLLAGASALGDVTRQAIIPGLLGPDRLRTGLAFNYGAFQATAIAGPGLGGLLIGVTGVAGNYAVNAASCLAMVAAALAIGPQPPVGAERHQPVARAIGDGLRFVVRTPALAGSFAIDLNAMTFGMPRALFAVLSLSVYHAGASGTGLLYAAIAVGGTLAVLTSGWVATANRLGRVVIGAVLGWGAAIVGAGLVRSIWPAACLLGAAGYADGISAVCRSTISQSLTPDHLRGRMSAVYSLVVTSGPRLGDIESGLVAGLVGALDSVLLGGIACLAGVGAVALGYPQLARYDAEEALASTARLSSAARAPASSARSSPTSGPRITNPSRPRSTSIE